MRAGQSPPGQGEVQRLDRPERRFCQAPGCDHPMVRYRWRHLLLCQRCALEMRGERWSRKKRSRDGGR